ncbi:MAG: nucleoside transporter C-terminal domain-containing protein [Pseudomonadota bacterium]
MELYNLVSFSGIFILIGLAWLISRFVFKNTARPNMHLIVWGIGLQLCFAFFIFVMPAGIALFKIINDFVILVLSKASAGASFLFGPLAFPPGTSDSIGFILAFQALPTIIFFSSLVAIFYYYPILPFIIRQFARLFSKLMKISGAESLCAASNIFVGVESAFTIKPYIDKMTTSELNTILTAGMATVASNVMALYVFTLQDQFPSIAGHLVSASFLSAPAALIMSKLFIPETGIPVTMGKTVDVHYERDASLFEAIINGSVSGLKVVFNISALLIAVLGLVALFDMAIGGLGNFVNSWLGLSIEWTLKSFLGWLLYPFTLIIGIPFSDATLISRIIGERLILTEVTSYQDLAMAIGNQTLNHPRSAVITAYALCGFAHVASMAIFVGGITALAPKRTADISKVAIPALIAATFACLMTACVAGTFFNTTSILLGP